MKPIAIQFHATPEEQRDIILWAHKTLLPFVLLERWRKNQKLDEVFCDSRDSLIAALQEFPFSSAYFFFERIDTATNLRHKGLSYLRFDCGALRNNMLEQSWLAEGIEKLEHHKSWLKVAKHVEEIKTSGVVAVNVNLRAKHMYRSQRYTEGAKRLQLDGVRMLPPQGDGPISVILTDDLASVGVEA